MDFLRKLVEVPRTNEEYIQYRRELSAELEIVPEVPRTEIEYNRCFSAFSRAVEDKNEDLINLIIIKDGILQWTCPYYGNTLLHIAVIRGTVETVTQMIKLGADVNVQDQKGETPLISVVKHSAEMVNVLINHGADVNISCKMGTYPLHRALLCGSEEIVELIIDKALSKLPKNSRQDENLTEYPSLNFTSRKLQNSKKVVELLLNHKTDLNLTKKDYPLLILFAAKIGNVKIFNLVLNDCRKSISSITEEVLKRNVKMDLYNNYCRFEKYETLPPKELNYQGYFDRSALHYAVREQLPEVVRFLLNERADVNARTRGYYTPLHYAACLENEEICKILLSFGALVNEKSSITKETPLHLVCGRSETRNLLKSGDGYYYEEFHHRWILRNNPNYEPQAICNLEIVKLLLKFGADPEIPTADGTTPFLEACRAGCVESVKFLLSLGVNLRALDKQRNSALHHASVGESFEVVDLLLKHGFDIEIKNFYEYTPLHYVTQAEYRSSLKMIEYLVDCGADINARNGMGATPLHIATYLSKPEIVECLLELGAKIKVEYIPIGEPLMGYVDHNFQVCGLGRGLEVLTSFIALRENELGDYIHFYFRNNNNILKKQVLFYLQRCKLELVKLKARRIFEEVRFSFNDFLTRDFFNAIEIVRNEEIRRTLSSVEYRYEFPCYASLLLYRFERVKALEDSVEKTVNFIQKYGEVKLPMFVIVKILSYLRGRDFRIFGRVLSGRLNSE